MIGVGIDTVEIDRFRTIISRRPALLEKLFTSVERDYCNKYRDPAQSYAVRFAAKEATMKALGVGLGAFGFHDVSIVNQPSGAPILQVVGEAELLAQQKGVQSWHISLSHSCSTASAVVIAE